MLTTTYERVIEDYFVSWVKTNLLPKCNLSLLSLDLACTMAGDSDGCRFRK